jgi:hypothetical protein
LQLAILLVLLLGGTAATAPPEDLPSGGTLLRGGQNKENHGRFAVNPNGGPYDADQVHARGRGVNQHRSLGKEKSKKKTSSDVTDPDENCVGDIQTISTSVLLNFEGDFNSLLDPVDLEAIGDVFEVAYNRLAEASCEGGSFRVVVDGVVQSDDTLQGQRDLQRISQGPKPFLKVSKPLIAVIIWQCNACGKGSKLLTNDAGRRTSKLSEAFENYYDEDAASSTRGLQQVGVLDDDACAPCGPLSPDDFIVAYNEVLQEFIESGVVFDGISSLVSANELEEVDCSDDVKVVETTLAIAILGDPSEASEAEIALLEDSVASTLNSLNTFNPDTCDPFFRSVASVEVDRDVFSISTPPERHLMLNFKFKVIPFKTLFKIKFKCQGCPDGDNLLKNDVGRRQLLDVTALDFEHYRRLQDVATPTEILTEGCLCAVGADEFLPPTREEFDAAFNVTVTAFIAAEAIDFIFQVGVTQELDEISCAAGVDSRESQLEIDGLGDPNDLTPGNLTAIEEAIRASLDTLYAQSCDPEVRVILDVEIAGFTIGPEKDDNEEADGARRLQLIPPTKLSKRFKLFVDIVFSCKGCPDSPSSLFGNDAGRRLSNIEVTSDSFDDPTQSSRNLQFTAGEQCFCDVNVVEDVRTPTLAEFEALFAINVAILELPVTLNTTTVSENTQAPTTQAPSTTPPTTPLTDVPTTPQPVTAKPVTVAPVAPSSVPETVAPAAHPFTDNSRICTNNELGEVVCECRPGYRSPPFCDSVIDECSEVPGPCDFLGEAGFCADRDADNGFYACGCRVQDGWIESNTFDAHGPTSCLDRNECTGEVSPCHPDATCTNLEPGFECTCDGDLVGDGTLECNPLTTSPPTAAPLDGCQIIEDCTGLNEVCDTSQVPPSCLASFGWASIAKVVTNVTMVPLTTATKNREQLYVRISLQALRAPVSRRMVGWMLLGLHPERIV